MLQELNQISLNCPVLSFRICPFEVTNLIARISFLNSVLLFLRYKWRSRGSIQNKIPMFYAYFALTSDIKIKKLNKRRRRKNSHISEAFKKEIPRFLSNNLETCVLIMRHSERSYTELNENLIKSVYDKSST